MFALVLGVSTGGFAAVALWAADGRPRLTHWAIVAAVAASVALLVSIVGVW